MPRASTACARSMAQTLGLCAMASATAACFDPRPGIGPLRGDGCPARHHLDSRYVSSKLGQARRLCIYTPPVMRSVAAVIRRFISCTASGTDLDPRPISENLMQDIIPFVEKRYRYRVLRKTNQLDLAARAWRQLSAVKAASVRLVYVGCGVEDATSDAASTKLVELLRKLDMRCRFKESTGGHAWFNWRIYLSEFAPLLFR